MSREVLTYSLGMWIGIGEGGNWPRQGKWLSKLTTLNHPLEAKIVMVCHVWQTRGHHNQSAGRLTDGWMDDSVEASEKQKQVRTAECLSRVP